MYRFLRLSSCMVINTKYITRVIEYKEAVHIHFLNHEIEGGFFLGSGGINTDREIITIDKEKSKPEYDTIMKWMNEIDKK